MMLTGPEAIRSTMSELIQSDIDQSAQAPNPHHRRAMTIDDVSTGSLIEICFKQTEQRNTITLPCAVLRKLTSTDTQHAELSVAFISSADGYLKCATPNPSTIGLAPDANGTWEKEIFVRPSNIDLEQGDGTLSNDDITLIESMANYASIDKDRVRTIVALTVACQALRTHWRNKCIDRNKQRPLELDSLPRQEPDLITRS